MKKSAFLLIVGLISIVASAGTVSFQADKTDVIPGEVVKISVVATDNCTSIYISEILSDVGGTALNFFLNPGFIHFLRVGTAVNSGNTLITGIAGIAPLVYPPDPVMAGEVLYSFDFTVPYFDIGSPLTISAAGDLFFQFDDFTDIKDIGSVALEVIPEPITIALLGLGGLFIRRRK